MTVGRSTTRPFLTMTNSKYTLSRSFRRPSRTSSTRIERLLVFVTTTENCGRVPVLTFGVEVATVTSAAWHRSTAAGDTTCAASTEGRPATTETNRNLIFHAEFSLTSRKRRNMSRRPAATSMGIAMPSYPSADTFNSRSEYYRRAAHRRFTAPHGRRKPGCYNRPARSSHGERRRVIAACHARCSAGLSPSPLRPPPGQRRNSRLRSSTPPPRHRTVPFSTATASPATTSGSALEGFRSRSSTSRG